MCKKTSDHQPIISLSLAAIYRTSNPKLFAMFIATNSNYFSSNLVVATKTKIETYQKLWTVKQHATIGTTTSCN